MEAQEPVGTVVDPTYVQMDNQLPYGTKLYLAPGANPDAKDAERYRAMRTASVVQDHAFIYALSKHDPRSIETFDAAIEGAKK